MTRPAPFPHRYEVQLAGGKLLSPPRAPIALGPPPQFGGSDEVWSPEELLVGAALECLWTTFEAYARHEALTVHEWSGTGVGVLDKAAGGPVFTSIALTVAITVSAADVERARRTLALAEQQCIISRALRASVSVDATVRIAQPAGAS